MADRQDHGDGSPVLGDRRLTVAPYPEVVGEPGVNEPGPDRVRIGIE